MVGILWMLLLADGFPQSVVIPVRTASASLEVIPGCTTCSEVVETLWMLELVWGCMGCDAHVGHAVHLSISCSLGT